MFSDIGYMAVEINTDKPETIMLKTANKTDLKIVFEREIQKVNGKKFIPVEFIQELMLYVECGFEFVQIHSLTAQPGTRVPRGSTMSIEFQEDQVALHTQRVGVAKMLDVGIEPIQIKGKSFVNIFFLEQLCKLAYRGYKLYGNGTLRKAA